MNNGISWYLHNQPLPEDTDGSGFIESNEFIRPLSRWVHDSKTAPRYSADRLSDDKVVGCWILFHRRGPSCTLTTIDWSSSCVHLAICFLRNRHDWCVLWGHSCKLGLWLICLFLGFVFPLFLPWNRRKNIESPRSQTKRDQRQSKDTKGTMRQSIWFLPVPSCFFWSLLVSATNKNHVLAQPMRWKGWHC